jgi:hypothetical protein
MDKLVPKEVCVTEQHCARWAWIVSPICLCFQLDLTAQSHYAAELLQSTPEGRG